MSPDSKGWVAAAVTAHEGTGLCSTLLWQSLDIVSNGQEKEAYKLEWSWRRISRSLGTNICDSRGLSGMGLFTLKKVKRELLPSAALRRRQSQTVLKHALRKAKGKQT